MKMRVTAIITALLVAVGPAQAQGFTSTERDAALERIADLIDENYVYADKATEIATKILGWKNDPALASIESEMIFASALSERLKVHDAHFSITWQDPGSDDAKSAASHGPGHGHEGPGRRSNYGFQAVERLDGNVGYLRMNFFADFDRDATKMPPARRTGEAAMEFLEKTDAMIIDLRQNGGGSPAMVHLIFSHFVKAEPMLINTFYERQGDRTVEFYSFDKIANKRRPATPLFVLTSARTGSAAEEFAYNVQAHGRGVIVGEASAGAANPGDMFDAGGGFSIFISTGAAINPITGTNWEGTGVKPDVSVAADAALNRAHELALAAALDNPDISDAASREAEWTLEWLRAKSEQAPLKRSTLRRYAGKYGKREIVVTGDRLVYKRGRRPEQTLIALGDDLFAFEKSATTRARFARDSEGRVTTLTLLSVSGSVSSYSRTEN